MYDIIARTVLVTAAILLPLLLIAFFLWVVTFDAPEKSPPGPKPGGDAPPEGPGTR